METHPLIQVVLLEDSEIEKWILKEIFFRVGYPFTFDSTHRMAHLKVSCSLELSDADLILPPFKSQWREIILPEVTVVEGYPLLHLPGKPPSRLVEDRKIINFDIIGMGYYFLSGASMELEKRKLNLPEDRFSKIFGRPLFDEVCALFKSFIDSSLINSGHSMKLLKETPQPSIAVTHDIDHLTFSAPRLFLADIKKKLNKDDTKLTELLDYIRMAFRRSGLKRNRSGVESCCEKERNKHIRSTFFVSGATDVIKAHPSYRLTDKIKWRNSMVRFCDVARILEEEGWEFGLHGSMLAAESPEHFQKELDQIKHSLGIEKIIGNRYHRLFFLKDRTLNILNKISYGYDSTYGFNHNIGFVAGTVVPFSIGATGGFDQFLEIPLLFHDAPWIKKFKEDIDAGMHVHQELFKFVEHYGGVYTQNWHPERFLSSYGETLEKCFQNMLDSFSKKEYKFLTLTETLKVWIDKRKDLLH